MPSHMGRTRKRVGSAHLPEVRQSPDPNSSESYWGVFGVLQWRSFDAPQAVGVLSSQEEKQVVTGTDWWLDFAVGDGDYEIVDDGDGTFSVRRKDYSTPPPPPPPETERPPVCLEHRHIVRQYVGFSEIYDYCDVCDAKRINGKWVRN